MTKELAACELRLTSEETTEDASEEIPVATEEFTDDADVSPQHNRNQHRQHRR